MLTMLKYFLTAVEALCCLLLLVVILIQKTRSQGMGLAFGANMGEMLFGSQVGNVLTKTTVILAIIFLVNTTLLAFLGAERGVGSVTDRMPGGGAPIRQPVPSEMPVSMSETPAPSPKSEMPVSLSESPAPVSQPEMPVSVSEASAPVSPSESASGKFFLEPSASSQPVADAPTEEDSGDTAK